MTAQPWIGLDEINSFNRFTDNNYDCSYWIDSLSNAYPLTYAEIYFILSIEQKKDENFKCHDEINHYLLLAKDSINEESFVIGYQSGTDDPYMQTAKKRYYENDNIYLTYTKVHNQFAYKINLINDIEASSVYFDESYLSYKLRNNSLSVGRISRWWSPSNKYSLILSNSARPSYGIELKNLAPITPNNKLFSLMGHINYEFFLNKLEKNRSIPNTILFGNRVSFQPSSNLNISLLRLAQFGGDDRPKDFNTFINLLIGKDNSSNKLSSDKEPGNQLAGIDFSYFIKNKNRLKIYGQMIGEDEAGFFPARKIYLYGSSFILPKFNNLKVSFDYIDTFSGIQNYTYNHYIYEDGLRYYKKPIGASIDADSEAVSITLNQSISDSLRYELSINEISLNKNNSNLNYWSNDNKDFTEINLLISHTINDYNFEMVFVNRNKKFENFRKSNIFFRIKYNF